MLIKCEQNGETALHIAAAQGHEEIVSYLLARGADPYIRNHDGILPKRLSQEFGHDDITNLLQEHTIRVAEL